MLKRNVAVLAALLITASTSAFALPPAADGAEAALNASPRHGEYVHIALPDSEVKMKAWVVFPERADKAPVVLVIHEIFGLSDWVRSVADAFAAEGYIAVAPDLIAGIEGAEENPREAISHLTEEEAAKRLDRTLKHALALPAASGKAAVAGYCWGGKTSFYYAGHQPKISGAVVFYGTSPDEAVLEKITMPVLGLYGEDDARVNTTIAPAKEKMDALGKSYEPILFDGAGHGFLRQQGERDGANLKAAEGAWKRTMEFLKTVTD